jgi:hypothetical protein
MIASFVIMGTFWILLLVVQMDRRKSWLDLFIVMALFAFILETLVGLSVPHWVIISFNHCCPPFMVKTCIHKTPAKSKGIFPGLIATALASEKVLA